MRGHDAGACAHDDGALTVAERARLVAFKIPKRRDDWLAGRLAAKAVVVAALGERVPGDWPARAIEIGADRAGVPHARVAPEAGAIGPFRPGETLPLSLSISHAERSALAAAAWLVAAAPCRLGVDLAAVEPRSDEFIETFFTEEEKRFVAGDGAGDRNLRANLVWCAKEAVLKALGVGLTVDTREVSCLPDAGLADPAEWPLVSVPPESPKHEAGADDSDRAGREASWRPFVATCGPPLVPGGGVIRGVWRTFPGFVAALARDAGRRLRV